MFLRGCASILFLRSEIALCFSFFLHTFRQTANRLAQLWRSTVASLTFPHFIAVPVRPVQVRRDIHRDDIDNPGNAEARTAQARTTQACGELRTALHETFSARHAK